MVHEDDAPVHIRRNVRAWMQRKYEESDIGRYATIYWPARCPDLTARTFFWGGDRSRWSANRQQPESFEGEHHGGNARDAV